MDLKSKIKRVPEFKGVVFWDITPFSRTSTPSDSASRTSRTISGTRMSASSSRTRPGVSSSARPSRTSSGSGSCPSRKKGKLPPKVHSLSYSKEYESDVIEIRDDGIEPGDRVLLVDDLLATGGTIKANADLVEKLGGKVVGMGFLVELEYLNPRKLLGDRYDIHSLIKLESTDEL